ncbi:unnamed protein product [Mytilus coruscus]|uniref:Uncharacterized protein n=1 Tax=Mytilus coruscus TaxID=42192 RepID=A0A6J8ATJ3_MYTCO|nr:unnamed protein product [Mytilus coruscus]
MNHQLLFSDGTSVRLFDTKTGNISILADGYSYILFLDYHFTQQYIFWSDFSEGTISRLQYPAEVKTAPEIIINTNDPTGVAVDTINDHLYWSELKSNRILRSHLNGSSTTVITSVTAPLDLELDMTNGLLYILSNYIEILQCRWDGSECRVIREITKVTLNAENIAIESEVEKGYLEGPFDCIPFEQYRINPIGVAEGKYNKKKHLIVDLSAPHEDPKNPSECRFYDSLKSANKRSSDYILDYSEDDVLSDHDLETNWYRIISDNRDMMPTSAPGYKHCGTINPIWLNANFPKEIVPVNVDAELIEGQSYPIPIHGNQFYPSLLPVFRCKFTEVSEGSYVYDVLWYINGVHVISHLNVPFPNINSTVLRDTDWINEFKMNMEPEKYEYTVIEGESIDITFTSTVPVGCISSHDAVRRHCEQNLYIFQPKNDQTSASCRNNIAKKDVVFKAQFCGISIKSLHWQNENKLRVYGFSDSMYNYQDRSTVLKISTSAVSDLNDIWSDIQVPDIKSPETFINGWTEETALQTCMEKINNALLSELTNLVDVSVFVCVVENILVMTALNQFQSRHQIPVFPLMAFVHLEHVTAGAQICMAIFSPGLSGTN